MKPFIYVASPYTKGDPCMNTCFQLRVFDRLVSDGVVDAYIPLWSHFQHSALPQPYQVWIDYDLAIIKRLDGVIRLNASLPERGYFESKSSGADGEVAHAQSLGKPTWYHPVQMYDWALKRAERLLASASSITDPSLILQADVPKYEEYIETIKRAIANVNNTWPVA